MDVQVPFHLRLPLPQPDHEIDQDGRHEVLEPLHLGVDGPDGVHPRMLLIKKGRDQVAVGPLGLVHAVGEFPLCRGGLALRLPFRGQLPLQVFPPALDLLHPPLFQTVLRGEMGEEDPEPSVVLFSLVEDGDVLRARGGEPPVHVVVEVGGDVGRAYPRGDVLLSPARVGD